MKLELRDLQTAKNLSIPAQGAVFGREGGDAQIKVADMGVSKRHARIYAENGVWYIEDLNSSNGTYVSDERVEGPTRLRPGLVLQMSNQQFEVVKVIAESAPAAHAAKTALDAEDTPRARPESNVRASTTKARVGGRIGQRAPPWAEAEPTVGTQSAFAAQVLEDLSLEPAAPRSSTVQSRASRPPRPPPPHEEQPLEQEEPAPENEAEASAPAGAPRSAPLAALTKVPRALSFYLGAMPMLALQPLSTVRRGIANQRHEPMDAFALIAYGLPAYVLGPVVSMGAALPLLVSPGASVLDVLRPLTLAVALATAVVVGLVWHAVVSWVVRALKGKSDLRSQTNMFLMVHAALALSAVPVGLQALTTWLSIRPLILVPALAAAAVTALAGFVGYSWLKHFGVTPWALKVLLGLVAAGALSSVAAGALALSRPGAPSPATPALEADKATVAERGPAAVDESAEVAPAASADAPTLAAQTERPSQEPKARPQAAARVAFPEYQLRRDELERAIAADPTLLRRSKSFLESYRRLQVETYEVEKKYASATQKAPAEAKLNEHLKAAEVFERTAGLVTELHAALPR